MTKKLRNITPEAPLIKNIKPYVPAEPIDFRMGSGRNSNKPYVPAEPIDFRMGSGRTRKIVKESHDNHPHIHDWLTKNDNHEHGENADEVHNKLAQSQPELHGDEELQKDKKEYNHYRKTHTQAHAVHKYTESSRDLNQNLIDNHKEGHPIHSAYHEQIRHLDTATNTPINHHAHMYSGVGFHPGILKHYNNDLHLPAYSSFSTSKHTAHSFATGKSHYNPETGEHEHHIIHVHLEPHNKARVVQPKNSSYGTENEIITPRHTILHVHDEPEIYKNDFDNRKVHIWHATIKHPH